jgi:outer membrane protein OmpA-like peptidoglycan-associated protein
VAALFAPRHPGSGSRNASFEAAGVLTLAGRHELDLYLDEADGSLVFLRDRFDDSLGLAGGRIERRSGFTLVFYRGGTLAGRAAELASLQGSVVAPAAQGARAEADEAPAAEGRAPDGSPVAANADAGEGGALGAGAGPLMMAESVLPEAPSALAAAGVDLLDTGRAIVLRVRDLRFLPDSDSILPSERDRIDLLAAALLKLPGRSFLVEGHAASTGRPEGELELSKLRAKRLVDELVLRGIPASALIYRGLGSTRPLASNDTEEGRAQNRRVEITILE